MAVKKRDGSRSKQKLKDTVTELMTERGTTDISLSEIAARSGLNSALIKYHFGSKQGLMIELVEDIVGSGLARMNILINSELSPTEKLRRHLSAITRTYFSHPYLNRLIHSILVDSDPKQAQRVASTITKPLAEAQGEILKQGVERGLFRNVDPMMFYFIVNGACEQLFFAQNSVKFGYGMEISEELQIKYSETLIEIVLLGLEPR